ncbi:MAG: VWA domain-containing protein [Polyangiaceae bacterium]
MIRVLSELFWALRREGLEISVAQTLDAARAVECVGFANRADLAVALEATLVTRRADRPAFHRVLRDFLGAEGAHPADLFGRLAQLGFTEMELSALRDLLEGVASRSGDAGEGLALTALSGNANDLEWLLRGARIQRAFGRASSPSAAGFVSEQIGRALGLGRAADAIARIGRALEDAVGAERGALMTAALRDELASLKRRIRLEAQRELERRAAVPTLADGEAARASTTSFASLTDEEVREVRRGLRALAEKLRGAARTRARRARRGRIDPARTLRLSARTLGVPVRLARRRRARERPKLIVACDVSDSVRAASQFLLELVAATSELFASTRSFVFVARAAETTKLFGRGRPSHALASIASGAVVPLGQSSHYGRAFEDLEAAIARSLDRRTTLVVLGDGRTNNMADGAEVLARLRRRARALVWICPESRERWGQSDSRMVRYAEVATRTVVARTGRELEEAARALVRTA